MDSRIGLVSTAKLYIYIQNKGGLSDHKTPGFGHPCVSYYLFDSEWTYFKIPEM